MISCQKDDKPIVWIDSGMHGREWITVATGMNILKKVRHNFIYLLIYRDNFQCKSIAQLKQSFLLIAARGQLPEK